MTPPAVPAPAKSKRPPLTTGQVARRLGVSTNSVRRLCKGCATFPAALAHYRVGTKILIPAAEVDRYLSDHTRLGGK